MIVIPRAATVTVVPKFCFMSCKDMSVFPGLKRSANPGKTSFNVFSPAGAGHPLGAPEDLPFQGSRLRTSFSQGFRFAPTLG